MEITQNTKRYQISNNNNNNNNNTFIVYGIQEGCWITTVIVNTNLPN